MRISIHRDGIYIFPENGQDVAFLADTLGLENPGDAPEVSATFTNGVITAVCVDRRAEAEKAAKR